MVSGDQSGAEDRYLVISVDGHVGPPLETFREYCPAAHLGALDEQIAAVRASWPESGGFAEIAKKAFGYDLDPKVIAAADRVNQVAGGWDPDARRRDMDADGIAAEVIFHGLQNGQPLPLVGDGLFAARGAENSAELDTVGCRIYNRWLADFVSGAPHRHAGLAYLPLHDVDLAVAEVEWAREHGLRGVNFPAPRPGVPALWDGGLDPLYDACAQLDMPLTTHTGAGRVWFYDDGTLGKAFQMIEGPWVARRGVWHLILSGAFERFPRLKLVLTEIFGQWVPEMVRDMDHAFLDPINPPIRRRLPRLPSEYWEEHCYVGASMMSRDEALLYPEHGARALMWGSDYPHIEGTFPYTRLSLQTTFHGLPRESVAAMLGGTAAEAYGFDPEALRPIADAIGPTVAELAQPPAAEPGDEYIGFAFRESTSWPADSPEALAFRG
ncbi:MAG TPA: amidohydrolase family protein [Acidimicrobiales bacterium]|nr:amidohydrolase family protein [Acidimicrobiales bacterium]